MSTTEQTHPEAATGPLTDWLDAHTKELLGVVENAINVATRAWLKRPDLVTTELLYDLIDCALTGWLDDHSSELIRTIAENICPASFDGLSAEQRLTPPDTTPRETRP